MIIAITVIVAVAVVLSTALVAAAISTTRQSTPCLFDGTVVNTTHSRFDGGKCSGKPENVYVSYGAPTQVLNGMRACNGHTKYLLDLADALIRES